MEVFELTVTTQEEVDSLVGVRAINGNVSIGRSSSIRSLRSLWCLESVGGLRIQLAEGLTDLTGLEHLASIGGDLYIGDNEDLTSLAALEGLTSVGGYVAISELDALTSLAGLDRLSSVGRHVSISGNDLLASLAGLNGLVSISGSLSIYQNPVLTDLALPKLVEVGRLGIYHNASLSLCHAVEFAERLNRRCEAGGWPGVTCTEVCTCTGNLNDIDCH